MPRKPGIPSYRQDSTRPGSAIVTLTDSQSGQRRTFRRGAGGSAESREHYARLIAQRPAA